MTEKLTRLKSKLHLLKEQARGERVKFLANLEQNPLYALQWADALFLTSARERMAEDLLQSLLHFEAGGLDPDVVAQKMKRHVEEQAFLNGETVSQSTSVCSNLVSAYTAKSWAALARDWSIWL